MWWIRYIEHATHSWPLHISFFFFHHLVPSSSFLGTGSWHCNSTIDHNISSWKGDWFHQTIHVIGNFNHDQEAGQEESGNIFLHEPTFTRNLDVYHTILLWCISCYVSCFSFFTPWMEIWGNSNWTIHFKWFFPLQQPLVFSWSNHATELWRLPQVWHSCCRQCILWSRSTLRPSFVPPD